MVLRLGNGTAKIALDFLKRSTFSIVGAVAVLKLTYQTLSSMGMAVSIQTVLV
jgi:hypothetical protein